MAEFQNESAFCGAGIPVVDLNNDATATKWYSTPTQVLLANIGIPAVLTIGIPANLAFLFMLYRVPRMRTVTNFYLANLAVSDTLYLCFYSLIYIRSHRRTPFWPLHENSEAACLTQSVTLDLFYFSSNYLITLVAVERYYAVCHPLRSLQRASPYRRVALVVVTWALALAFAVVVCPRLGSLQKVCIIWPETNHLTSQATALTFCWASKQWSLLLSYCLYVGIWSIGVVANLVMYVRIVRRLGRRNIGPQQNAMNVRNKVARMLIINSAVFFILQMPRVVVFNVFALVSASKGGNAMPTGDAATIFPIAVFLVLLNSAVNPYIFTLTNPKYRQALRDALCCCCPKRRVGVATDTGPPEQNDPGNPGTQQTLQTRT
ncbi:nociceptin receptor-like [Patiria miniata]|uniref:G-protein coupled receptors family 1 profile domain-containing protein n=1 Tax=Patiria miniata TaxID=46514 RepID=A0A913ZLZ3_PATMI|nr:nociceptin receptor-like [Patiria miniata]